MKILLIQPECSNQDQGHVCEDRCGVERIVCPACGELWLVMSDEDLDVQTDTPCPHLRFLILHDEEPIQFFNGFTMDDMLSCLDPAVAALGAHRRGLTTQEFFEGVSPGEAAEKLGLDIDLLLTGIPEDQEKRLLEASEPGGNRFNRRLWSLVEDERIDVLFDYTDGGPACALEFPFFFGTRMGSDAPSA